LAVLLICQQPHLPGEVVNRFFSVLNHWYICQTHQTWGPSLTVNSDYFLKLYELTGLYNVDAVCFL